MIGLPELVARMPVKEEAGAHVEFGSVFVGIFNFIHYQMACQVDLAVTA